MNFFEKLGDQIEYYGKKSKKVIEDQATVLTQKSKGVVEIAKLKMVAAQLEQDLKQKYTELGSSVFKSYSGENLNPQELENLCKEIKSIKDNIEIINNKLNDMQTKPACPKCGNKNPKNAHYCSHCGYNLEKEKDIITIPKD